MQNDTRSIQYQINTVIWQLAALAVPYAGNPSVLSLLYNVGRRDILDLRFTVYFHRVTCVGLTSDCNSHQSMILFAFIAAINCSGTLLPLSDTSACHTYIANESTYAL